MATVEPKAGSTVPILVWEIQKKDEASLDLYEGYPNFYDKQMLEIELDGKIVPAMVYVMTPGHSFGIPSFLLPSQSDNEMPSAPDSDCSHSQYKVFVFLSICFLLSHSHTKSRGFLCFPS